MWGRSINEKHWWARFLGKAILMKNNRLFSIHILSVNLDKTGVSLSKRASKHAGL